MSQLAMPWSQVFEAGGKRLTLRPPEPMPVWPRFATLINRAHPSLIDAISQGDRASLKVASDLALSAGFDAELLRCAMVEAGAWWRLAPMNLVRKSRWGWIDGRSSTMTWAAIHRTDTLAYAKSALSTDEVAAAAALNPHTVLEALRRRKSLGPAWPGDFDGRYSTTWTGVIWGTRQSYRQR